MTGVIFFITVFAAIQGLSYYGHRTKKHRAYTASCSPPQINEGDIYFYGRQLGLPEREIHQILLKRFPYYRSLNEHLKHRFIYRLQSFMKNKLFVIKDDEAFKDMPVLVSAAAIQLTFGLSYYRFPFYKYIRLFPEEYIAPHSFNILTGTVQGNTITVAWNYLLKGYLDATDGQNVGLHEMSHALYIQKIVIEENYARRFAAQYNLLVEQCDKAFHIEAKGTKDLYTSYANTNLQEFWAESVELFFEKPVALKEHYPTVFEAMKLLLNQDPLNIEYPLLANNRSFKEKWHRFAKLLKSKD